MERVIEALEAQCHENMETKKKTEEGLGIEYDEDIVCEICQSVSSSCLNKFLFVFHLSIIIRTYQVYWVCLISLDNKRL